MSGEEKVRVQCIMGCDFYIKKGTEEEHKCVDCGEFVCNRHVDKKNADFMMNGSRHCMQCTDG